MKSPAAPWACATKRRPLHRDGHEFFVEVSLTALRRGDGYIINAFVRDITQRRAAEEQLIQAQKMESLGQLTGGIAHDFNNMLTVITGTIEILADGVKDIPHLASITKLISDAADRGANLTASLLAFARKQPLQPAEIDVNELIGEAVRLLSPILGKHIEVETALSGDAWPAFVDRSQLSAALVNLAINARDAMANGGKLTIATGNFTLGVPEAMARGVERAGDYVAIEVSDTGTGIPQADLDRIFDPFFSTKEVGRGTGLGLSMVFGFAKQSGGSVDVRSEEGSGTTFRIYLPKADTSALQPPAHDDDPPVQGGNETILCVEDDRKIRDYVTMQLENLGYKVIVAGECRRGPRHRPPGRRVRSAVHRYRDARKHERQATGRNADGRAAVAAGALHLRIQRRRAAAAGPRGPGDSAADQAVPARGAGADVAPLSRYCGRSGRRSDTDALFRAAGARAFPAQVPAEGGIGYSLAALNFSGLERAAT